MLEMAYEFDKRLKYVGNDVELWKMAQIFGKMSKLFHQCLKNVENDRDLGNGQNIWEMAQIHGKRFQYLRSGFTMLEMA